MARARGGSGQGSAGASAAAAGSRPSAAQGSRPRPGWHTARHRDKENCHSGADDSGAWRQTNTNKAERLGPTEEADYRRNRFQDCKDGWFSGTTTFNATDVLMLAMEAQGSREVQRRLDEAIGSEQEKIVEGLKGHVKEAIQSPHANHVLQKAISVMWPKHVKFIIYELMEWAKGDPCFIAKHQYGCRVLERLMEFFPAHWLDEFTEVILVNLSELSKHTYGNYVVQHLCEHGTVEQKKIVVQFLLRPSELHSVVLNQNGCGVVEKALTYAAWQDQMALVDRMLHSDPPWLLVTLALKRWGFATAELLVSIARGRQLDEVQRQLEASIAAGVAGTQQLEELLDLVARQRAWQQKLHGDGAERPR